MAKMINCKVCGNEIASSAKVCPHCGAKNKKKPIVLIVIIAILVIGVIGAISGEDDSPKKVGEIDTTPTIVTEENTPTQTKFNVGEQVELDDIVVTLVDVTETKGSQFNSPTSGNIFTIFEFEIENNSSSEITISSLLCFTGYCDDYALNYSLGALLEKDGKNQLDGTVAAGKKMNGVIGYEVPSDWKEIEVHFIPDFWNGDEIIFVAQH